MKDVGEFDRFLKRAKKGTGCTFQLHRKLGGAFIDMAYYDDGGLATYRLHLPEPVSIRQELRWDEHGFPYELETYRVGDKEVEVKLYRTLASKTSLTHFLEDVVGEIDESSPQAIREGVEKITRSIKEIVNTIDRIENESSLTSVEKKAVNAFFGDADMWHAGVHLEEDLTLIISEYLMAYLERNAEKYQQQYQEATERRESVFRQMEEQIISGYKNRLETQGFKEGYVRK